jgi:hypothetical protein
MDLNDFIEKHHAVQDSRSSARESRFHQTRRWIWGLMERYLRPDSRFDIYLWRLTQKCLYLKLCSGVSESILKVRRSCVGKQLQITNIHLQIIHDCRGISQPPILLAFRVWHNLSFAKVSTLTSSDTWNKISCYGAPICMMTPSTYPVEPILLIWNSGPPYLYAWPTSVNTPSTGRARASSSTKGGIWEVLSRRHLWDQGDDHNCRLK